MLTFHGLHYHFILTELFKSP